MLVAIQAVAMLVGYGPLSTRPPASRGLDPSIEPESSPFSSPSPNKYIFGPAHSVPVLARSDQESPLAYDTARL